MIQRLALHVKTDTSIFNGLPLMHCPLANATSIMSAFETKRGFLCPMTIGSCRTAGCIRKRQMLWSATTVCYHRVVKREHRDILLLLEWIKNTDPSHSFDHLLTDMSWESAPSELVDAHYRHHVDTAQHHDILL